MTEETRSPQVDPNGLPQPPVEPTRVKDQFHETKPRPRWGDSVIDGEDLI